MDCFVSICENLIDRVIDLDSCQSWRLFLSYNGLGCGCLYHTDTFLVTCSAQLLIEMLKKNTSHCFKLSDVVFIMLIHIKMPTIDGILIFMNMINFILS